MQLSVDGAVCSTRGSAVTASSCGWIRRTGHRLVTLSGMSKSRWREYAEWVRQDEGDVPGWVLITLMTAGLVLLLWGVAGPALTGVFEQAIERVSSL